MKLTINKKQILANFINPISRISENCRINVFKNEMFSTVSNAGDIILFLKIKDIQNDLEEQERCNLNIKDIRKVSKVFSCVNEEEFVIEVDKDCRTINHKSDSMSFKLHLVNDNVLKKINIPDDYFYKLKTDTEFVIKYQKLIDIFKCSVFVNDINKIYFYNQGNKIYAELTDKNISDCDSVAMEIADSFSGNGITTTLPFNIEILRIVMGSKSDITVKVNNQTKFLLFEIKTDTCELKYLISSYVK